MNYIVVHKTRREGMAVLEPILGSVNCERVLMFILARSEGYPREMATFYQTDIDPIRKQLDKLESGGVLASRLAGRTRLYSFNPRYPSWRN